MGNEKLMQELNKIVNEELGYSTKKQQGSGTSYWYITGRVGNKEVCFTKSRAHHNGKFGFYSWIQTHYKNKMIKRTKFARSGSKAKAKARAEKILKQLEEVYKNG